MQVSTLAILSLCVIGLAKSDTWTPYKKFDLTSINQIKQDWNVIKWLPGFVNDELENYVDSSENIFVENGMLVIKAVSKPRQCQTLNNKDIQGNDMAHVSGQPASACCGLCRAHAGCKTYSWNDYQGGTCWLKYGFNPVIFKQNNLIGYNCDLTSGRLESKRRFTPVQMPGKKMRVEYVAKVPTVMGAWPALWMLGKSGVYGNWPQEGEIDLMEWVWQIQADVKSSLHWKSGNDYGTDFRSLNMQQLATEFTTYGVEMSAVKGQEYIQFYMKTQLGAYYWAPKAEPSMWKNSFHPNPSCPTLTPGASRCSPLAPFDNQMELIMNFAVGGNWGGCCGVNSYSAFNDPGVKFYIRSATVYTNIPGTEPEIK